MLLGRCGNNSRIRSITFGSLIKKFCFKSNCPPPTSLDVNKVVNIDTDSNRLSDLLDPTRAPQFYPLESRFELSAVLLQVHGV